MSRVYHYTLGTRLLGITAAGEIRPAAAHVDAATRPAVWFSRRKTWEPTATKRYISAQEDRAATISEMASHGGALVRLEVAAVSAPHAWAHHAKWYERKSVAKSLELAARDVGADPTDWRVCYAPVSVRDVVRVEYSDDGATWHDLGLFDVGGGFTCSAPEVFERITASVREG